MYAATYAVSSVANPRSGSIFIALKACSASTKWMRVRSSRSDVFPVLDTGGNEHRVRVPSVLADLRIHILASY